MTEIILESIRTTVVLILFLLFLCSKDSRALRSLSGWHMIATGIGLLFLGSALDITDNFEQLKPFVIIGDTKIQIWLEEAIGYLGGFILCSLGFYKFIPRLKSLADNNQQNLLLKERYKTVSEMTSDLTAEVTIAPDGTMHKEWMTGSLQRLSGYLPEELETPDQWLKVIHPDDLELFKDHVQKTLAGETSQVEVRIFTKGKDIRWADMHNHPQWSNTENRIVRYISAISDITRRKDDEERIIRSLDENRVLLQELHHRVKNNLQVITGLMELAKPRIKDPEVGRICQDIHSKIRSMSLVHSQLYQETSMQRIDFEKYTRNLVTDLCSMYGHDVLHIDFEMKPVHLGIDQAIPAALALTEALTNAFKHAANEKKAQVVVSLHQKEDEITIGVRDNGPGFPKDIDISKASTMGLKLLHNLVTLQLRGALSISNNPGANLLMSFPVDDGQ